MNTPTSEMDSPTEQNVEKIQNQSDAVQIWRHMCFHDDQLSLKRKFLMGLSGPNSFDDTNQSVLPESVLREDDVFYEDVKNLVERGFGKGDAEMQECGHYDDVESIGLHNVSRIILAVLDDLSNNGLYKLAKLVTRGSAAFIRTRPQMKRVIKSSLPGVKSGQFPSNCQVMFQKKLTELLKNPKNFRQNYGKHIKLSPKSLYTDIMKVLDGLEDMPPHTLRAMHRKLKGSRGYMPKLSPQPSGWNKKRLIERIRKLSSKMIKQLGESDKLQEPLAKAMAVACLSSKIASSPHGVSVPKFLHVTPEVEALQIELLKAIQLLSQRTRTEDMKKLQHLLDPDSELQVRSLKTLIRKMLIQFLFECSDMDVIPQSLLDVVSIINKKTRCERGSLSGDLIKEDVDCILNLGAHVKQILWDGNSSDQLEKDFVDAYMEELEESDDGDIFDDDDDQELHTKNLHESQISSDDLSEEVGSTGDADDASVCSPPLAFKDSRENSDKFASEKSVDYDESSNIDNRRDDIRLSAGCLTGSAPCIAPVLEEGHEKTSTNSVEHDDKCLEQNPENGCRRNQYVSLQDVCDDASVVAYELVGHMLAKFGQVEALGLDWDNESYLRGGNTSPEHLEVSNSMKEDVSGSVMVEAVQKVLPSFSDSQLERLKKFVTS